MDSRSSVQSDVNWRASVALVVRRAPSKRSAINEFQVQHLCALTRLLVRSTLDHFEVEASADLPEESWEAFTSLPEYGLFTSGAYACGFVCSDLRPDTDLDEVRRFPIAVLGGMDLRQLRHYVHTLMRSERAGHGYGSVVYEALRAGALEAICERLERGSDLYETL